jgi:hypothetical protein
MIYKKESAILSPSRNPSRKGREEISGMQDPFPPSLPQGEGRGMQDSSNSVFEACFILSGLI